MTIIHNMDNLICDHSSPSSESRVELWSISDRVLSMKCGMCFWQKLDAQVHCCVITCTCKIVRRSYEICWIYYNYHVATVLPNKIQRLHSILIFQRLLLLLLLFAPVIIHVCHVSADFLSQTMLLNNMHLITHSFKWNSLNHRERRYSYTNIHLTDKCVFCQNENLVDIWKRTFQLSYINIIFSSDVNYWRWLKSALQFQLNS